MAEISCQDLNEYGVIPTWTVLSETSNTFENSGNEFIVVNNYGESSITITVSVTTSTLNLEGYGELKKDAPSFAVTASNTAYIGPFDTSLYNAEDSTVTFTSTSTTNVRVQILKNAY